MVEAFGIRLLYREGIELGVVAGGFRCPLFVVG
jgi:hypothetical protein